MDKHKIRTIAMSLVMLFAMVSLTAVLAACSKSVLTIASAGGVTELVQGSTLQFSAKLNENDTNDATFTIAEGQQFGTITAAGLLRANEDAEEGSQIKVKAKNGNIESNVVTITIKKASLVSLSITNDDEVIAGEVVQLTYSYLPPHLDTPTVSYSIVQGGSIATLNGSILTISDSAAVGDKVTVGIMSGTVGSQKEFTVIESVTIGGVSFSFLSGSYTADKNATTSPAVSVRALLSGQNITDELVIRYSVTAGGEFLTINPTTGVMTVTGDGNATVRARIQGVKDANGDTYSATVTVKAINPPTGISVSSYENRVRATNLAIGNANKAPFVHRVEGTRVAQAVKFEFSKKNGSTWVADNTIATVTSGEIKFAENFLGDARIIVSSNSGSRVETKSEPFYVLVNQGFNVSTWADFKREMEEANAVSDLILGSIDDSEMGTGKKASIVNLTRNLVDTSTGAVAFDALKTRVSTAHDVRIYGNGYNFDLRGQKGLGDVAPLIDIRQSHDAGNGGFKRNKVNIEFYDFGMYGRMQIDTWVGDNTNQKTALCSKNYYSKAIQIREDNANIINFNNIQFSGWNDTALEIRNGTGIMENVEFENNWNNHLQLSDPQIEIKNSKFGMSGRECIIVENRRYSTHDYLNALDDMYFTGLGMTRDIAKGMIPNMGMVSRPYSGISLDEAPSVHFSGSLVVDINQEYYNETSKEVSGSGIGVLVQTDLTAKLAGKANAEEMVDEVVNRDGTMGLFIVVEFCAPNIIDSILAGGMNSDSETVADKTRYFNPTITVPAGTVPLNLEHGENWMTETPFDKIWMNVVTFEENHGGIADFEDEGRTTGSTQFLGGEFLRSKNMPFGVIVINQSYGK